MPLRTDRKLQTNAVPLDELVEMVKSGEVRVPTFQRGLKWTRRDVSRLFESIVLGYPIGNLLLWRRSAEQARRLRIGALEIDAPAMDQALFVVDGQQRLTSLANVLSDEGQTDPRFALSYDVASQQFVPTKSDSVFEIPLPVIFDLSRLLDWYRAHPALTEDAALVTRANDVAKAIREYRVPIYVVDNSDPDVLRDIFDRMNNYGKQLSRAEIFSALHETDTGERTDSADPSSLGSIAREVHAITGYGIIDQDTILLAMLSRRGSDVSRDIRREFVPDADVIDTREFPTEGPDEARANLTGALVRSVRFLQQEAASPHFAFLPYRYLLVVLTRFFAHFPDPSDGTRRNLRRWFWRAASLGPELTKGSITQATRALGAKIIPGDEVRSMDGLLSMVPDKPSSRPQILDFRTNWTATRLLLAAMWHRGPMRLDGGSTEDRYSFEDLLNAIGESSTANDQSAYIYPTKQLVAEQRGLPSNRVFLAEPDGAMPESVLDDLWLLALREAEGDELASTILRSHFVDAVMGRALIEDDRVGFLERRQAWLMRELEQFLSLQAEWDYEDTPPLSSLALDENDGGDHVGA